jgi:hypothetical protein
MPEQCSRTNQDHAARLVELLIQFNQPVLDLVGVFEFAAWHGFFSDGLADGFHYPRIQTLFKRVSVCSTLAASHLLPPPLARSLLFSFPSACCDRVDCKTGQRLLRFGTCSNSQMPLNLQIDWTRTGVEFAAQTVFLTVALRLMLKQQKLACKFPGVLGSAILASALLHIPYAGIAISLIVLTLCVTKAIRARTFTDAIVAVGVSFAVLMVFNLLAFSLLMPMLWPTVRVRARTADTNAVPQVVLATNQLAATNPAPVTTPLVETSSTPDTNSAVAPLPPSPASTNVATTSTTVSPTPAPVPAPEPVFNTNQLNSARMAGDIYLHYFVRGVSQGASITLAMISNGKKSYDVAEGDTVQLETSTGRIANVKCESVAESKVVVSVDGVRVTLKRK